MLPTDVRFSGRGLDKTEKEWFQSRYVLNPFILQETEKEDRPPVPPSFSFSSNVILPLCPRVWVYHDYTGYYLPYRVDSDETWALLKRIEADKNSDLLPKDYSDLRWFGILQRNNRRFRTYETLEVKRHFFLQQGYVAFNDIVPPAYLADLANHFESVSKVWPLNDLQVELRQFKHNPEGLIYFHYIMTDLVSSVVGEEIKPSYCYAGVYHKNAELKKHTDREQCKWNVSLMIDAVPLFSRNLNWPLHVKEDAIYQSPGDLAIYSGQIPHMRSVLENHDSFTGAFLHYVAKDFQGKLK
jgi:hypothetical protein